MIKKILFMYIIIGTTFNILYILVYLTNATVGTDSNIDIIQRA